MSVVKEYLQEILSLTRYLAVDGYFAKNEFIGPLVKAGLHIIPKLRRAANLRYLYQGGQKKGKGRPKPAIIISTDEAMDGLLMCRYYGLNFWGGVSDPGAKQHSGLEDCQTRSKEKLDTHFHVALTTASVAKCAYWLPLPQEERGSFSMADMKMMHMNRLMTQRIFQNLDVLQMALFNSFRG